MILDKFTEKQRDDLECVYGIAYRNRIGDCGATGTLSTKAHLWENQWTIIIEAISSLQCIFHDELEKMKPDIQFNPNGKRRQEYERLKKLNENT